MNKIHVPVLLKESIDSLNIKPDGFYIDGTLGDGGHSLAILQKLSPKGLLVSTDQDQYAIDFVKEYYKNEITENWKIVKSNFKNINKIAKEIGREVDGILLDIGISSRQLEESNDRGFSYLEPEEQLDMRMDRDLGVTAKDLINALSVQELSYIFKKYGEEKFATKIAKEIKKETSNINTVGDLTRIIYKVVPADNSNLKNPSRRVFQALRIVVNDELDSLTDALENSFEILTKNGRISVISFHSLEDRIIKQFFVEKQRSGEGTLLNKNHIAPTDEEIQQNPRAASAKLRTLIKN